jgi:hypothetical protein
LIGVAATFGNNVCPPVPQLVVAVILYGGPHARRHEVQELQILGEWAYLRNYLDMTMTRRRFPGASVGTHVVNLPEAVGRTMGLSRDRTYRVLRA